MFTKLDTIQNIDASIDELLKSDDEEGSVNLVNNNSIKSKSEFEGKSVVEHVPKKRKIGPASKTGRAKLKIFDKENIDGEENLVDMNGKSDDKSVDSDSDIPEKFPQFSDNDSEESDDDYDLPFRLPLNSKSIEAFSDESDSEGDDFNSSNESKEKVKRKPGPPSKTGRSNKKDDSFNSKNSILPLIPTKRKPGPASKTGRRKLESPSDNLNTCAVEDKKNNTGNLKENRKSGTALEGDSANNFMDNNKGFQDKNVEVPVDFDGNDVRDEELGNFEQKLEESNDNVSMDFDDGFSDEEWEDGLVSNDKDDINSKFNDNSDSDSWGSDDSEEEGEERSLQSEDFKSLDKQIDSFDSLNQSSTPNQTKKIQSTPIQTEKFTIKANQTKEAKSTPKVPAKRSVENKWIPPEDLDKSKIKLSNNMADACKTQCKLCNEPIRLVAMRRHTKTKHKISITEYKDQFGAELEIIEKIYHECRICSAIMLLDSDCVAHHLKSPGHKIKDPKGTTHGQYNEQFMIMANKKGNK